MVMEPIPSKDILKYVRTKYEYNIVMSEIDDLQRSLYKTSVKSFERLLEQVSVYTSSVVKGIFSECGMSLSDSTSVKGLLSSIKDALAEVEFVKLTLAFEPSEEFIAGISGWVNQNLGSNLILDIGINSDIVGGIIMVYKGRYIDNSMCKLFEKKEGELKNEVSMLVAGIQ